MSGIREFYKDKNIFVTGGSGFIGKGLIEKLLRSCPDIGTIFILLRAKRGKSTEERLREFMENDTVFIRLREEQPNALSKVQAITGDCLELGLGISAEDLKRMENVSIIFHSAATVRFDEPLRTALLLNLRGTVELLKIAQNLPQLLAFVHVSTAYSNPHVRKVGECMYPPTDDWRKALQRAEAGDAQLMNILTEKYLQPYPNTYSYTKNLAEHAVNEYRNQVPVLILRPSVVVSSYREPITGWFDNYNGPIGLSMVSGFGIASALYIDKDCGADYIPVDIVVRSLVLAAYKRGQETVAALADKVNAPHTCDIINCAAGNYRTLSHLEYQDICTEASYNNPKKFCTWTPATRLTNYFLPYWFYVMFLDVTRGILLDLLLRLLKRKPFVMSTIRRIYHTNIILRFFSTKIFNISVEKCMELDNLLSDDPKLNEKADFSMSDLPTYSLKQLVDDTVITFKTFRSNEAPIASRATIIRVRTCQAITKIVGFYLSWLVLKFIWFVLLPNFFGMHGLVKVLSNLRF